MTAIGYASVGDIRTITLVKSIEKPDATVQLMINQATSEIDRFTGRTWQGHNFVNGEVYDGDGTNYLQLNHPDIIEITALKIKDDLTDNTYDDSITPSTELWVNSNGTIRIYPTASEATVFLNGPHTVSIAYKWGASRSATITTNLDAVNTTVTISDTSGFKDNGEAIIKTNGVEEWISYTARTPTTLAGVSRGQRGTTAATHTANDLIFLSPPDYINRLCIDIVANDMHQSEYVAKKVEKQLNALQWKGIMII